MRGRRRNVVVIARPQRHPCGELVHLAPRLNHHHPFFYFYLSDLIILLKILSIRFRPFDLKFGGFLLIY